MYRKARHILVVMALTASMLLLAVAPAHAIELGLGNNGGLDLGNNGGLNLGDNGGLGLDNGLLGLNNGLLDLG